MRLLIGDLSTTTGSHLTRELFRLEGWTGMRGKVPEFFTEFPRLHLKGAKCIFGVLPEFCICVPGCHVK